MEDWKNKIKKVLNRHWEIALSDSRSILETIPAMTTEDEAIDYYQKLQNSISDQWHDFLINSQK